MKARILIVDDEANTREGIARALRASGYDVILAKEGKEALEILKVKPVDLLLTDLRMSGMGGLRLIDEVKLLDSSMKIIAFTAYGSIETAVEAMKRGAHDYLSKPINLDELELILQKTLRAKDIEAENKRLRQKLEEKKGLELLLGQSEKMHKIHELIQQVAVSKATVLIQGESGTGKELIARAIHDLSPRRERPFIAVHCAALSETLLESELFGHEKGAFTGAHERYIGRFERADGGSLFLDEISEISPKIQVKLLRVLQETSFERVGGLETIKSDVRVISATNRILQEKVREGSFREDLFYRLHVVFIEVPPLRDRREDIPLLVQYFLTEEAKDNDKSVPRIHPLALERIMAYDWPGNVRELKNCIQSMIVLNNKNELMSEDLPQHIQTPHISLPQSAQPRGAIRDVEKNLIIHALKSTRFNKTKAAEILGISRRTLHRKLHEYAIQSESSLVSQSK